jgi:putative ABC transport system ATP-binding protein
MLAISGLTKTFGNTLLFSNLDLMLDQGAYVAIMGESGSGKSTFLNLVAGLEPPDAGSIVIGGEPVDARDDDAATLWRRRALGFVFQSFHLLPALTVEQNIALPLKLNAASPANIRERTQELIEAVGLGGKAGRYPRELSGGECQRVAIARALVHRPSLLLADEPTGNLDPTTAEGILQLLQKEVRAQGTTALLVTHSLHAAATADRCLKLTANGLVPCPVGGN